MRWRNSTWETPLLDSAECSEYPTFKNVVDLLKHDTRGCMEVQKTTVWYEERKQVSRPFIQRINEMIAVIDNGQKVSEPDFVQIDIVYTPDLY